MTPLRTLAEMIASLQQAEHYSLCPPDEPWATLIERISVPGQIAETDEETYFYFLEVLPPKYQRGGLFAFAEGAEALRLFWQRCEQYFCRQLTSDETAEFCRVARIPLPW